MVRNRHHSLPVKVAGVTIGGQAPIVVQSMTNTDHLARAIAVRLGRERNANGVADALLQQDRHRGRGGDDALGTHPGLG